MRKFFAFILFVVLVTATWLAYGLFVPVKARTEFVLLRPGWSTRHIAQELRSAGAIRSSTAFLLYHYILHPRSLKAGEYHFDREYSGISVHERLVRGDVYKRTVVVPEGFNIFDIAAAVETAGLANRDEFLQLERSSTSLISDIDPQAMSLEGYLFPDTYQFTRTQSPTDIVSAMVRRFRQEARAIGLLNGTPDPAQLHRVVTMASIVEKETAAPEERPMVASVYYNRLGHNMALDADPSVVYAALLGGRYSGVIHVSDLHFASPYNTYVNAGLPPGPICNPGRASLQAALHPAATNYLYFVSDNQGHHRFARTLDEHSRNVLAYRRSLAGGH